MLLVRIELEHTHRSRPQYKSLPVLAVLSGQVSGLCYLILGTYSSSQALGISNPHNLQFYGLNLLIKEYVLLNCRLLEPQVVPVANILAPSCRTDLCRCEQEVFESSRNSLGLGFPCLHDMGYT